MAGHLIVQASGAMFSTIEPDAWAHVFGRYVTDETGVPVPGLKKSSFTVFELTTIGQLSIYMVTDVNADFPSYKIPGVYRVQTTAVLGNVAPSPQESSSPSGSRHHHVTAVGRAEQIAAGAIERNEHPLRFPPLWQDALRSKARVAFRGAPF